MKEADRARYLTEASSLAHKLHGSTTSSSGADPDEIWDVYAMTEKLIAVLRFRLDYETPAIFTKLPDAGDPPALLKEAQAQLSMAVDQLSARRSVEAIETLRKARNQLRSYLTDLSKAATKADRKARTSRASKSTTT